MPSADPGSVIPRTKRIKRTTYGKSAVNQTTCKRVAPIRFVFRRYAEKENNNCKVKVINNIGDLEQNSCLFSSLVFVG